MENYLNYTHVLISLLIGVLYGAYNAWRGSGAYKVSGQKPFQMISIAGLGYFINGLSGLLLVLPIPVMYIDTGSLMQAWTTRIKNIEYRPGLNWLAIKWSKPKAEPTYANAREYGVKYGTLLGGVFFLPFLLTDHWYWGLPSLSYGLICGVVRYDEKTWSWRAIEFFYILQYISCYCLANPQLITCISSLHGG